MKQFWSYLLEANNNDSDSSVMTSKVSHKHESDDIFSTSIVKFAAKTAGNVLV